MQKSERGQMVCADTKLGAGEAARLLGFSPQYLALLARKGRVKFEATPYGRVYERSEIERLAAERLAPVAA